MSAYNSLTIPENATAANKPPPSICAIHGDVGDYAIDSTIKGHEMRLCLRCFLEKLKDIGVCELKDAKP